MRNRSNFSLQRLKREKVEFIVAPYEADAQLAFLSMNDIVHAVITEDSDLLVFGCKRVLFKMDKCGQGEEIALDRLGANTQPINLAGFDMKMFRQMCILSGCDYLPSVPGLGIRKSYTLIKTCRTAAQAICVIKNKGMNVPSNYDKLFEQAELTFLHQRVWDPEKLQLVHLTPLLEALQLVQQDNLSFLGPFLSRDVAQQIATGIIHPDTKLHYVRPAPASSLRRSAPVMATTTPPARNTKIGQFFAPMRPQTSPRVSTGPVNLGVSPYFNTSNKVAPIKSRFLINRSASSPSLHLPKTIQKQFVRPPVRKQEKEEASEGW